MNKLAKGTMAAAAGIALLLGASGTLALWNDSAQIGGSSITSGEMTLTAATGNWEEGTPTLWVPGESYTYSVPVEVKASGDNLSAELAIDTEGLSGDEEFLSSLVYSVELTNITENGVTATPGTPITLTPTTPAGGTLEATAEVTVEFPATIDGTTAQNQTVNLDDLTLSLTQIAN